MAMVIFIFIIKNIFFNIIFKILATTCIMRLTDDWNDDYLTVRGRILLIYTFELYDKKKFISF